MRAVNFTQEREVRRRGKEAKEQHRCYISHKSDLRPSPKLVCFYHPNKYYIIFPRINCFPRVIKTSDRDKISRKKVCVHVIDICAYNSEVLRILATSKLILYFKWYWYNIMVETSCFTWLFFILPRCTR